MATNLIILGENAKRINVKVNPNMTVLKVSTLHYNLIFINFFFYYYIMDNTLASLDNAVKLSWNPGRHHLFKQLK